MLVSNEINQPTIVLDQHLRCRDSFARHFFSDIVCPPLRRNNYDINSRRLKHIPKHDFLSTAGHESAHFVRIGINHEWEPYGVSTELMDERRGLACATPDGYAIAADDQFIQLRPNRGASNVRLPGATSKRTRAYTTSPL